MSIRNELDQMKAELEALRKAQAASAAMPAGASATSGDAEPAASLEQQLRHFLAQAEEMLAEAEDTVSAHPAASIAGALALGILIGRLTAR